MPVSALYYPTEFSGREFSIEKFKANKNKTLLFVGHWMRDYESFFRLKPIGYRKRLLMSGCQSHDRRVVNMCLKKFKENIPSAQVSNDIYDRLLEKNVCFIKLFGASANTTVIECMVRKTPLLVNKLPAVVEYLGNDYPLYYESLDEVVVKLNNWELIRQTHEYMGKLPQREFLTKNYFIRSVKTSEVYQNL